MKNQGYQDVQIINSIIFSILPLDNAEGAILYHDFIQLRFYERARSNWLDATKIRIAEFRTTPVLFSTSNKEIDSFELKMTKNHFPFGATMRKQIFDDVDYRDGWPDMFNYGVPTNEMKWNQNEKVQGVLDFSYADQFANYWDTLDIPFRGHAIYWGTTGTSVHVPQWFDENPTFEAMLKRVSDAAGRYEGRITGWDVFNEILHDGDYFQKLFGDNIFNDMLAYYRRFNPSGKAAINDYEVLRYV